MDKVGVTGKTLREQAEAAVDATEFYPAWGRARLEAMIKNRPIGAFRANVNGVAQ